MKMRTTAMAVLVGGLLVSGCGGGGESTSTAEGGEAQSPSGCLDVPAKLGKAIAAGSADGSGMKYESASAYKSEDHSEMYYIAMRFSADGVGDQEGVWASNSLKAGDGLILSVDGFANEFTIWPDGAGTDAATSVTDPGAEAALNCLA